MDYLLSKSDFKIAFNCPPKLYYKKKFYPNLNEIDEYLAYLAQGGYMVGKLATLLYPDGVLIDTGTDHDLAIEKTKKLLNQENVTIFEAAFLSKGKIIRVDILEKKGILINLIEVKAKSFETTDDESKKKKIQKELEEYILDVAFQYYVINEAYPEWTIKPFLFLPDKSKNTQIDGLASMFEINEVKIPNSRFKKYDVSFVGNIKDILNDDILTLCDVEQKVIEFQPLVKQSADLLLESLEDNEITKIAHEVSKECFKCEYVLTDDTHPNSGFDECWDGFPKVKNHISELYHIGSIGGYKKPLANELIKNKLISLDDFPVEQLGKGTQADRQRIQIKYTLEGKEWINEKIREEINNWNYPLHFIDFETTMSAIPMHKGMRPYEVINFQWSCHTIEKPDGKPVHSEWISLESSFPSFKFAESLMKTIGTEGTTLIWSPYENTMLNTILKQFSKYGYQNPELKEWLEYMVKSEDNDGKLVDMNKVALQNYFHPLMKGKTSIKCTLPAVLKANKSAMIEELLENFETDLSLLQKDIDGVIINPYLLLPPLDIYENAETIKDGTGAMRAYEDVMFGLRKGDFSETEKYRKALLRYCKLDTLAMVIIWLHWKNSYSVAR